MLVVPVYNMLLTPDATVFFQMDQLRRSAGGYQPLEYEVYLERR